MLLTHTVHDKGFSKLTKKNIKIYQCYSKYIKNIPENIVSHERVSNRYCSPRFKNLIIPFILHIVNYLFKFWVDFSGVCDPKSWNAVSNWISKNWFQMGRWLGLKSWLFYRFVNWPWNIHLAPLSPRCCPAGFCEIWMR